MASIEDGFTDWDETCMHSALEQAKIALEKEEVPVGCVICRDGKIIAHGHNETNMTRNGTRHAEMIAIDKIIESHRDSLEPADFSSCTLYVTCEPCIMCAGALSLLRFKSVIYGCANDKFGGNGSILSVHENPGGTCGTSRAGQCYPSRGGLFKDDAIKLLQDFYISGNPKAPKPHRPVK
ncbi:hypothetical protein M9435_004513 [Picochlorum sp. BPE23]|nr:hypothetical protein M9435_004513 [Picochlorum sp. BPE23]